MSGGLGCAVLSYLTCSGYAGGVVSMSLDTLQPDRLRADLDQAKLFERSESLADGGLVNADAFGQFSVRSHWSNCAEPQVDEL